MKSTSIKTKIRFFTGWKAIPFRLKFWTSFAKYLLNKRKYPLFILKASRGGVAKIRKIRRELGIGKVIKSGRHYYTTLIIPHWPSKPFDHMVANGGLNFAAIGTPYKRQIDLAILAMTRKCNYSCKHCYEHFNLAEKDAVPVGRWKEIIKDIQKIGVSVIAFSGGEPMLRYQELLELIESADKDRSDLHIYTSGDGVSPEKARSLRTAGLQAAAIGLDDVDPKRHDSLRGYRGSFEKCLAATRCFQNAGVFTYINLCLTKDLIRSGDLPKYFELAKDLNIGAIRLLEPRPCGGYFSEKMDDLFSEDDRKIVTEFFMEANRRKRYKDYPPILYQAYFEAAERMGCMMGGHSHFHIDSLGNVEPCVFLPISFGSIMKEDFMDILRKMRKAIPSPLHKPCPAVSLAEKIREKKHQGVPLPIPFNYIKNEFQKILETT